MRKIDALLPVERKVPVEFGDSNVSNQSWGGKAFVYRLHRLAGFNYMAVAIRTRIFVLNVLEQFKDGLEHIQLLGDFEAEHLSRFAAARAGEFGGICNLVFDSALNNAALGDISSAATMLGFVLHDLQGSALSIQVGLVAVVDRFACAGQRLSRDFSRTLAEYFAVAAAHLLLQFVHALLQELYGLSDSRESFQRAGL